MSVSCASTASRHRAVQPDEETRIKIMRLGRLRRSVALIAWAFLAGAAHTEVKQEDPRTLIHTKDDRALEFRTKLARELMTKSEFDAYQDAIHKLDCAPAEKILNRAFVRAYPQFARIKAGPNCQSSDCFYWKWYATTNFRAYRYCTTRVDLRLIERWIVLDGILSLQFSPAPRWQKPRDRAKRQAYKEQLLFMRDYRVSRLITLAGYSYRPALVFLARRIRQNDLFNAGPDVEFLILQHACFHAPDCRALMPRIKTLRSALPQQRAAYIATRANRPKLYPWVLEKVLIGKKLEDTPDFPELERWRKKQSRARNGLKKLGRPGKSGAHHLGHQQRNE